MAEVRPRRRTGGRLNRTGEHSPALPAEPWPRTENGPVISISALCVAGPSRCSHTRECRPLGIASELVSLVLTLRIWLHRGTLPRPSLDGSAV